MSHVDGQYHQRADGFLKTFIDENQAVLPPDVSTNVLQATRNVLKDGEAFDQLVHVVERIGVYLTGTIGNLGEYSEPITQLACISPLAIDIPVQLPEWHVRFTTQYDFSQFQIHRFRNRGVPTVLVVLMGVKDAEETRRGEKHSTADSCVGSVNSARFRPHGFES